jgi:hypothetical protein
MPLIQNLFASSLPYLHCTRLYSLIQTNFHPLTSARRRAVAFAAAFLLSSPKRKTPSATPKIYPSLERHVFSRAGKVEPKGEVTDLSFLSLFLLLHLRHSQSQQQPRVAVAHEDTASYCVK